MLTLVEVQAVLVEFLLLMLYKQYDLEYKTSTVGIQIIILALI